VGLGLPVYNGSRYLRATLDSVLAQDFGDFELWISDNASTDATEEICRACAARDPRIRYHRSEHNLGQSPNFRRAFELARGEYFKWVVHDDLLEPGYLRACVGLLDAAPPSAVLAYPKTILIDENGAELQRYEDRMDIRDRRPSRRLAHLLRYFHLNHCGLGLIRREALARTRLIGPFEHSDIVLLAELAIQGQFWEHPEYLYRRRIHDQSSFAAYSPQQFAARMDARARPVRVSMPRTRLFVEISRSIAREPLGLAERLRCEGALLREWVPRFWRVVGGEWKRLLLYALGRAAPGATRRP
jgi:glycosyltransferase involved in cell wall biosynthesis